MWRHGPPMVGWLTSGSRHFPKNREYTLHLSQDSDGVANRMIFFDSGNGRARGVDSDFVSELDQRTSSHGVRGS